MENLDTVVIQCSLEVSSGVSEKLFLKVNFGNSRKNVLEK